MYYVPKRLGGVFVRRADFLYVEESIIVYFRQNPLLTHYFSGLTIKTPEQEALLHGLNFREYPSIQEL